VNRPFFLVALGLVVIAAAIALNFLLGDTDTAPEQPKSAATEPEVVAEKKNACIPPSFDVVRINPYGDSVMAGRGTPKAQISILDEGKPVGIVVADDRGEWVFVPTQALPAGSRHLSLKSAPEGCEAMESPSVVVLVVPEKGKDVAGQDGEGGALAVKVDRDGKGPSKVLQKPGTDDKLPLSIDVVDYDEKGRLSVSGRAKSEAKIFVYLDTNLIGNTSTLDDGIWSLISEKTIEPGLYTLRADQVDDAGKVIARVSIPFSRADIAKDLKPGEFIVVQPGNSLWRLARRSYGTGFSYTTIYQANKDQIQDPNLIYPGQIFTLPK